MKKYIFALATLAFFGLYAAPKFQHQILITQTNDSEYLAEFKIDKIVDENTDPVTVTAPKLLCLEGQESIVSKKVKDDGYTIKALIYLQDNKTKAKTSITLQENNEIVYTIDEEFDVNHLFLPS